MQPVNNNDINYKQSETGQMTNVLEMMMRTSESPLESGMLPRAFGDNDDSSDGGSRDNYRF